MALRRDRLEIIAFRAGVHEDDLREYLRAEIAERTGVNCGTQATVVEPATVSAEIDWAEVLKQWSPEELASYGIAVP